MRRWALYDGETLAIPGPGRSLRAYAIVIGLWRLLRLPLTVTGACQRYRPPGPPGGILRHLLGLVLHAVYAHPCMVAVLQLLQYLPGTERHPGYTLPCPEAVQHILHYLLLKEHHHDELRSRRGHGRA